MLARTQLRIFPLLLGATGLLACGGGTIQFDGDDDDPNDPRIDNGFESGDPTPRPDDTSDGSRGSQGSSGSADSGDMAGAPEASNDDSSQGAERAIEEADIVKIEGARLYALSRYGGLSIIDVGNPNKLRILGRKRLGGVPFEFYLRGSQAYVMLNEFSRYLQRTNDDGTVSGEWVETSEMLALDLSNESAPREFAHYDIPGNIADSRLVGDAMYVVTSENGYCWGCERNQQGAVVTSFNIGQGGIAKIDQLSFTSPQNGYTWQRSVSATNQRLYIAGPEYNWQPGQETANSVIQVVDIRDPQGRLRKGADVPVHGQITNRWQMDEHNGVLRVVSQNTQNWWGGTTLESLNPRVQTFAVRSSDEITPLGQTELILPEPESLRSVRFDGDRGYAITAELTDPLYTIDLSDPANPRQAAELELPGWITHMEPRGDRLIGFGYADTTWSSPLAVSLFDVSDLESPTMLERVEFANAGGHYAEDQDRIHKSVQIIADKGLILVPFASWGRWSGNDCSDPVSGIQLIDYDRDGLTLRGVAPQYGQSRRALFAGSHLLAMSDRTVTSFDIAQRDAPAKTGEVDLSNPAYQIARVGNQIASITNDWWTSEVMLSLTPERDPDDAATTAKLSLAGLADPSQELCNDGARSWASWYAARLFATSPTSLVVSVPVYNYRQNGYDIKMVYGSIDLSDVKAPKLVKRTVTELGGEDYSGYYGYYGCGGFFDGYGYYSFYGGSLLQDGDSMVQVGHKLAYLESQFQPNMVVNELGQVISWKPNMRRRLHVVDFANLSAPTVHTPLELGTSRGSAPLMVSGEQVFTSRWRRAPNTTNKVKFYLDRFDLSGDVPQRLTSLNTPGSPIAIDAATQRLVTVDFTRESSTSTNWESCYNHNGPVWFDHNNYSCVKISRNFKLSDLNGDQVTLRNTYIPPTQGISGLKVAEDRIYLTKRTRYSHDYDAATGAYTTRLVEPGGMLALGGIKDGTLRQVSEIKNDSIWPLAARGTTVALYTDGGMKVFDTSTPTARPIAERTLRGWGYASGVLLEDNRAICSVGEWGLESVPLAR